MMQSIIIEDEDLIRDVLAEYIRQIPFIGLTATCRTAMEAIDILQHRKIDLVFLDIQLQGLSGLDFLRSLNPPPLVIMVTAYQDYAVEAFELNVVDYILKPFSFPRLLKACHRALQAKSSNTGSPAVSPSMLKYFFVNCEYALVKIAIDDIVYVESMRDYIKIHLSTEERPVITRMTLKAIQEKLPGNLFMQTHKSFVIALSKITLIKRDFVCMGKSKVPLSDSFRVNVLHYIKQGRGAIPHGH